MKFTIVTPVFNGERFIRETIESVISQAGSFEIEYFIIDGKSQDQTITICETYKKRLEEKTYPINCNSVSLTCVSEPDQGMYDAINKGFQRGTGDIYAYLNADDTYVQHTFEAVANIFSRNTEVQWLKGVTTVISETGTVLQRLPFQGYHQDWVQKGIYGREAYFIHQDSVFWRAGLWQKAGPIDHRYRFAGDYDLWRKFAAVTPLYSVDLDFSCFRKREGQLSQQMEKYRHEQDQIIPKTKTWEKQRITAFFWAKNHFPAWKWVFKRLFCLIFPRTTHHFMIMDAEGHPTPHLSSSFLP